MQYWGNYMRHFKQMTFSDRIKMEVLLNAGHSKSEVAHLLHFHRSTIYREYDKGKYIHRNSDYTETEKYSCNIGQNKHDLANEGKGRSFKIGKDHKLADFIENKIINDNYSPEAALAFIENSDEIFETHISVRTLYRYIDSGLFVNLTNKNLPIKGKKKKKNKKEKTVKRASAGESIENRPEEVDNRDNFGHWEMDTVKGKKGITKSCLLVLTERKTRNEIIFKMPTQGSADVVKSLDNLEHKWGDMFYKVFKTITVDNGVEFSDYIGLEKSCRRLEKRTKVYYCHPYSSYERGSNENNNRLIRRHIPKGVDFDDRTNKDISLIESWINNYPRKLHKYKSAGELFDLELSKII